MRISPSGFARPLRFREQNGGMEEAATEMDKYSYRAGRRSCLYGDLCGNSFRESGSLARGECVRFSSPISRECVRTSASTCSARRVYLVCDGEEARITGVRFSSRWKSISRSIIGRKIRRAIENLPTNHLAVAANLKSPRSSRDYSAASSIGVAADRTDRSYKRTRDHEEPNGFVALSPSRRLVFKTARMHFELTADVVV